MHCSRLLLHLQPLIFAVYSRATTCWILPTDLTVFTLSQIKLVKMSEPNGSTSNQKTLSVSKAAKETDSSANQAVVESDSPLRTTLAIGQLIASNRPTAGSKLLAHELRHLSKTVQEESISLRKEIANLSTTLSNSLKTLSEDDDRGRGAMFGRRPMFGNMNGRRIMPRGRGRGGFIYARKGVSSVATNTPTAKSPNTSKALSAPEAGVQNQAQKQVASKLATVASKSAMNALDMIFKNPWRPRPRRGAGIFDEDDESDFTDEGPNISP